jgi:hypothetical protein
MKQDTKRQPIDTDDIILKSTDIKRALLVWVRYAPENRKAILLAKKVSNGRAN